MKFLTLTTLIGAAALAIPALLLLYFLKLRRQEREISSTLLWRKAVQDLQVNAPFQKLRRNLLLFLQLLVLAGLIFALGQPVAKFARTKGRTLVMLVDQSASTKAREASGVRLDAIKQAAATFVQNMGDDEQAMVISFADRAQVVCPFTRDKRQLVRQIESVRSTDARSTLAEALQLAVAYSSRVVDVPGAATPVSAAPPADIELFSDGRIADADEQIVQRGSMRYYKAGDASDNVGIVSMDVRRNVAKPGQVSIFVRVENFGPDLIKTDVTLLLDGKILSVREVALAGASDTTTRPVRPTDRPSAQSLAFELEHESAGLVELRIERADALAADNVVFAPLAPPKPLTVLGVSDRPIFQFYLGRVLRSIPGLALEWIDPAEYDKADESKMTEGGRLKYDLVIFDRFDTSKLPPGNYVFFGGVPKIDGVAAEGDVEDEHVANWDETHPVMRYVLLDNVSIAKWRRLKLPKAAVKLVEGETSPIIAMWTDPGRQFLVTAFDLLETDFPLRIPFVLFTQNVVRVMTASGGDVARMLKPGDSFNCPVPRGATHATITRPDGTRDEVNVSQRLEFSFGRTGDVGVYVIAFDDEPGTKMSFAVNLLDRTESMVRPNDKFSVGAERVVESGGVERVNQPLWPYAVLAAVAFLLVEWWVYNRRVMI